MYNKTEAELNLSKQQPSVHLVSLPHFINCLSIPFERLRLDIYVNKRIVNLLYEFHIIHNLFLEMQEHWETFQSVELKINVG